MKRFVKIIDNKIFSFRTDSLGRILDGEIEATEEFDNVQVGMILLDGVWQKDPQEITKQIKQNRIAELKELITNKNYLGDDVTLERTELRQLLGL